MTALRDELRLLQVGQAMVAGEFTAPLLKGGRVRLVPIKSGTPAQITGCVLTIWAASGRVAFDGPIHDVSVTDQPYPGIARLSFPRDGWLPALDIQLPEVATEA